MSSLNISILPIDEKSLPGHYSVAGSSPHWLDANGFLTPLLPLLGNLRRRYELKNAPNQGSPVLHGYYQNSVLGTSGALPQVLPFRATEQTVIQTLHNGGRVEILPHTLYVRDETGATLEGWDRMLTPEENGVWVKVMERKTIYPTPSPQLAPIHRKMLWRRLGRYLRSYWIKLPDPKPDWRGFVVDTWFESPKGFVPGCDQELLAQPTTRREQEVYREIMGKTSFDMDDFVRYARIALLMTQQLREAWRHDQQQARLMQRR